MARRKKNTSKYNKILKYYGYNTNIPSKKKATLARKLLNKKLCSCIKTVKKRQRLPEPTAIAICSKSVLHKKGIKIKTFKCKKKYKKNRLVGLQNL